jgi:hypothetical protein
MFWSSLKRAVHNWLERLAKSNQESFGNGRMDCCSLNRNPQAGSKNPKN